MHKYVSLGGYGGVPEVEPALFEAERGDPQVHGRVRRCLRLHLCGWSRDLFDGFRDVFRLLDNVFRLFHGGQ